MNVFNLLASIFLSAVCVQAAFADAPSPTQIRTISATQFLELLNSPADSLVLLCADQESCKYDIQSANYLVRKSPDVQAYLTLTWNAQDNKLEPVFKKEPFKTKCESEFVFIHAQKFSRLGQLTSGNCHSVSDSDLVEWVDRIRPTKIESDLSQIVIPELAAADFNRELSKAAPLILIETGAKWCAWCVSLKKELRFVKNNFGDQIQIYSMNYDKDKNFLSTKGISLALPGLTLMKNGRVLSKHEGYLNHEAVIEWIRSN